MECERIKEEIPSPSQPKNIIKILFLTSKIIIDKTNKIEEIQKSANKEDK